MALKLNSSGGGSVTIDPVSTASNVTITIPATNAGSLVTADSSGNVGIGTSSPGQRLDVVAVEMPSIQIGTNDVRKKALLQYNEIANTFTIGVNDGYSLTPIIFRVNGADRMTLNASGNLGLGVTPSAWASYKAIQVGPIGSVSSATGATNVGNNWFYDGASKYITTAAATLYEQGLGTHRWYTAPSGTAGNPITFTQAMTLDASGNLIFGGNAQRITGDFSNATIANRLAIQTSTVNGNTGIFIIPNGTATSSNIQVSNAAVPTNSSVGIFGVVGTTDVRVQSAIQGTGTFLPMTFYTGGAEKMRLDTTGNVTPGVTNTQTLGAVGDVWSNVHTNAVTATGDIQATSYNGGQLAGLRNKIINGNMGIFQRGTTAVTVSGLYGPADRWISASAGNTFSTTQGSFVSGDTLYDTGGAQYFTQIAVTSVAGAINYFALLQRIEDVRILAGQTVTVSFWAKAASGTPTIGVSIGQNFGSGGTPTGGIDGVGQAQSLTTTWAKYTKTFEVPSINGKTIGTTANTSYTNCVFWLDAGSTYDSASGSIGQSSKTVSIAQVQLEIGSVATPFEHRPIGMELALCQRYYYRNTPGTATNSRFGTGFNQSTTVAQTNVVFPVEMRTAPTALEQSGTAANYSIALSGNAFNACSSVPTFVIASTVTGTARFTTASAMSSGQGSAGTATAATAYLGWSAEL